MPDIRNVYGLWCDDITFCQEECEHLDCPRNQQNIRDRSVPHSFSVEIPKDCPKKQESRKSKTPDREKVIYDIERCICHVPDACRDCSHYKHGEYLDCMEELLKDAIALLKEQEAEIRQLRLALDIAKGTCKGIAFETDEKFMGDL